MTATNWETGLWKMEGGVFRQVRTHSERNVMLYMRRVVTHDVHHHLSGQDDGFYRPIRTGNSPISRLLDFFSCPAHDGTHVSHAR